MGPIIEIVRTFLLRIFTRFTLISLFLMLEFFGGTVLARIRIQAANVRDKVHDPEPMAWNLHCIHSNYEFLFGTSDFSRFLLLFHCSLFSLRRKREKQATYVHHFSPNYKYSFVA